jgi:hypothetical protein
MRAAHLIVYENKTNTIAGWAIELGIKKATIDQRLWRGWTVSEALSTPVGRRCSNMSGVPKKRKIIRAWFAVEDDRHSFEPDCEPEFLTLDELVRNNSDFTMMEADSSNSTFDS